MKYSRFEDLPVWKAALELGLSVFALTDDQAFASSGGLKDQLRRAAVSVSNNIAEGFERGTTAELLAFLYIARGSAGEVRSMLMFLDRWPEAAHLKPRVAAMAQLAETCSRQIRGWAESLQNSEIKGQRHLTDQSRSAYQSRKRADAWRTKLAANQEQVVGRWVEEMQRSRQASSRQASSGSNQSEATTPQAGTHTPASPPVPAPHPEALRQLEPKPQLPASPKLPRTNPPPEARPPAEPDQPR